jgi:hypothetical protein
MRPPTELERLAVFLAAMAVTRALLPRTQPTQNRPSGDGYCADCEMTHPADLYRARYGADNPGAN